MSSGQKRQKWDNFKDHVAQNRKCKKEENGATANGYIAVQRLTSTVDGKCQKYNHMGPLTLVQMEKEPTLDNIKEACKAHFDYRFRL